MAVSDAENPAPTNDGPEPPTGTRRRWIIGSLAAVIVAVPTAIATDFGADAYTWVKQLFQAEPFSLTLEEPSQDDVITSYPTSDPVSGTLEGDVPGGATIWLANRPAGSTAWHVMAEPCGLIDDNEFDCGHLFLGTGAPSVEAETFTIQVWVADPTAAAALREHAERPAGTHPGTKRPEGAQVVESIEVEVKLV